MNQPLNSLQNQLSWEDVLEASSHREGERSFLLRLVQFICQQHRLEAAALFSKTSAGDERWVSTGSETFPAALDDDVELDFEAILLPDGLLLYRSPENARVEIDGPLILALSSALGAARLRGRIKQQSFAINYRGVELEALYDVGLAIASMLNLEQLGEEILIRAVSLLDARRGALYLRSGDRYVLDHTFGGDAREELPFDDPQIAAVLDGRLPTDQDLLPGAHHLLGLPIGVDGSPQGVLIVADKESRQSVGPFQSSDRRSLSLFANQAAIALETAHLHRQALEKERLERELELAAEIQRRLLPTVFPRLKGFEVAGWSRPARHVGGDYYDLMRVHGDRLAAVLADVSGKGMPAALMVSTVHSALRLLIAQEEIGPELVYRLNHHISESSAPNKFITLLLAELEPESSRVRYVNAGHNPGLLVAPGGRIAELESGGLPLGLFDRSSYRAGEIELGVGDLICIYSDGITESTSPEDEEFGVSRFVDLLRHQSDRPLAAIVKAVDRAVSEFADGLNQADDQTLILIRRTD